MADATYHQRRIGLVYEKAKRIFSDPQFYHVGELSHRHQGFFGIGRDHLTTFRVHYKGGKNITLDVTYSEKRTTMMQNAFEVCISRGKGILGSQYRIKNMTGSGVMHCMQDLEETLYQEVWLKRRDDLKACPSPTP